MTDLHKARIPDNDQRVSSVNLSLCTIAVKCIATFRDTDPIYPSGKDLSAYSGQIKNLGTSGTAVAGHFSNAFVLTYPIFIDNIRDSW